MLTTITPTQAAAWLQLRHRPRRHRVPPPRRRERRPQAAQSGVRRARLPRRRRPRRRPARPPDRRRHARGIARARPCRRWSTRSTATIGHCSARRRSRPARCASSGAAPRGRGPAVHRRHPGRGRPLDARLRRPRRPDAGHGRAVRSRAADRRAPPGIDAGEAIRLAVEDREDVDATATLAIEGRTDRLVWTVELAHRSRPANFAAVEVDAHARTVVARTDRCEHGVVAISVRHYSHPGGIKDGSARPSRPASTSTAP